MTRANSRTFLASFCEIEECPLSLRAALQGRPIQLHQTHQTPELVNRRRPEAGEVVVEENEAVLHRVAYLVEGFLPRLHRFRLIPLRFLEFCQCPVSNEAEVDCVGGEGWRGCEVLVNRPNLTDIVTLKQFLRFGVKPRLVAKFYRIPRFRIQLAYEPR